MKWIKGPVARLLAGHFVLVALATALALGFVYWRAGDAVDEEQREVVETELRALADDYAQGGLPALALSIERRLAHVQERDAVYLLATPGGAWLAGNLATWPEAAPPGGGWTTLQLRRADDGRATTITGVSLRLAHGERLLVGRDVAARAAFNQTLLHALVLALAAVSALSLGAAWLVSRFILNRVREVSGAADAIMGGALDRRIALSGSDDAFDGLARSLNAMLDRIAALVADLNMVTESLAHDLRSPLGRMERHLAAALDEGADPETRNERIEAALGEAQATLGIATRLLEISRIEAGAAAEQFGTIDLGRLAQDVAELYAAAAEERSVKLALDTEEGVAVAGHPQLLAQALSNLLDNAIAHAPAGSTITVEASRSERSHAGENGDGAAILAVSDQGPGIPANQRERVRQRFVRLDPSRGAGGQGLGLALVDAVVRLHGAALALGESRAAPTSTASDGRPGLRAEIRFGPGPAVA